MTYEEITQQIDKTEAILKHFQELCLSPQVENDEVLDFLIGQRNLLQDKWKKLMRQRRQIIMKKYKKKDEEIKLPHLEKGNKKVTNFL
ncbi:hypothetical protein [Bacillus infantis]|uniref:hypothetical protein n=1 Tax=Bacillus infantis TaxID=324767 RepID=UPI003CF359A0